MIASAAVIFSLGHKQQQNAIIGRCVGYLSYIRDIDIRDTMSSIIILVDVFVFLIFSKSSAIFFLSKVNHPFGDLLCSAFLRKLITKYIASTASHNIEIKIPILTM